MSENRLCVQWGHWVTGQDEGDGVRSGFDTQQLHVPALGTFHLSEPPFPLLGITTVPLIIMRIKWDGNIEHLACLQLLHSEAVGM